MIAVAGKFRQFGIQNPCTPFTSGKKLIGSHISQNVGGRHCFSTSTFASVILQHLPTERKTHEDNLLVVLYGWLMAKSKHLHKFGKIYNSLGADVMTVKPNVFEVLRPTKAEELATTVLDTLQSSDFNNKAIVIHGFSVGGYMYAQTLNKIVTESKYASVKGRIVGQIFDSPVDFNNIPYGVSNATTNNVLLNKTLQFSIQKYFSLTRKYTMEKYLERSKLFFNNPVRTPALFLFSNDDPVALPEACERCAATWKDDLGMDVIAMKWNSSPHVSHFYKHQEEYTSLLVDFYRKVNDKFYNKGNETK